MNRPQQFARVYVWPEDKAPNRQSRVMVRAIRRDHIVVYYGLDDRLRIPKDRVVEVETINDHAEPKP